jgi:hypothetical protein
MSEPLFPSLSIGAQRLICKLMAQRQPTADICAAVVEQCGEVIAPETVDKARLIYRSKVNSYLATQEDASILASVRMDMAIDQAMAMSAIEQQWAAVTSLSKEMAEQLAGLATEAESKIKLLTWCNEAQNTLATTTQKLVQAQILVAKAAIELPYRKSQLSGEKEELRNEITPEFLKEIEGMLGILPYDAEFDPVAVTTVDDP